jgi:hypothetical protein
MEKDIAKIPKNPDTDIIVRIDDFGGRVGLTIREFVRSERYTGFTKAGTRVPLEYIGQFKEAINSIEQGDIEAFSAVASANTDSGEKKGYKKPVAKQKKFSSGDIEESEEVVEDGAI